MNVTNLWPNLDEPSFGGFARTELHLANPRPEPKRLNTNLTNLVGDCEPLNRATPASTRLLERYCRLDGWPRSWMGSEKDVPPGEKLVARFLPFLEDLVASDLSPKTVHRHVDNLWALGGEIMRELNENPSLRRKRIEHILDDRIDDEGGPLVYILESEESLQHSLDYTSRKLFQFLGQSSVLNRKITHRFPRRGII